MLKVGTPEVMGVGEIARDTACRLSNDGKMGFLPGTEVVDCVWLCVLRVSWGS